MIRVLVQARRGRARAGLEALIRSRHGLALLEAPPGGSLADRVVDLAPDVVLLDAPEGDPTGALRGLEALPHPPAVVLLAGAGRVPSAAVLRAGVRAVLPLEATGAEIAAAVEAAAAGLVALRPESVGDLRRLGAGAGTAGRDAASRASDLDRQPLTARETEILGMIAEGLGNKLIAARLGISGHTVKFHVASIFAKLGAGSRTEAVTIGLRRGLILI